MRRLAVLALGCVLALTIGACGSTAGDAEVGSDAGSAVEQTQTTDDAVDDDASEGLSGVSASATDDEDADDGFTQLATPFVECANMQEAADVAGFGMDCPESIGAFSIDYILAYTTDPSLIEVTYTKGDDEYALRKAPDDGTADISGVYETWGQTSTFEHPTHDDVEVTAYGTDDLIYVLNWTVDDYTFSAWASAGMDEDTATTIVSQTF